jgi:phosphoserine phosphatase
MGNQKETIMKKLVVFDLDGTLAQINLSFYYVFIFL